MVMTHGWPWPGFGPGEAAVESVGLGGARQDVAGWGGVGRRFRQGQRALRVGRHGAARGLRPAARADHPRPGVGAPSPSPGCEHGSIVA
jgi:hypothetical protein